MTRLSQQGEKQSHLWWCLPHSKIHQ